MSILPRNWRTYAAILILLYYYRPKSASKAASYATIERSVAHIHQKLQRMHSNATNIDIATSSSYSPWGSLRYTASAGFTTTGVGNLSRCENRTIYRTEPFGSAIEALRELNRRLVSVTSVKGLIREEDTMYTLL